MWSKQKNASTKELIASAIENNVLFAALDEDQIGRIVEEMWCSNINKGDNWMKQTAAIILTNLLVYSAMSDGQTQAKF